VWEAIQKIKQAVNPQRAFESVLEISQFHRIQASPGYRAAATWVANRLQEDGFEVKVHSYPANPRQWYFQSKMFQEWDCQGGKLSLVTPEKKLLADYSLNPLSICPKSYGMDFREHPVNIVLMDKGPDPEAYPGLKAEGALLFIRGLVSEYMEWAIQKTGAIGFITDFMRELKPIRSRYDLPDALNYVSFWWKHIEGEPKVGGFTLSPHTGDNLAELCRKMAEEHAQDPTKPEFPQAKGFIDARLYDGAIEVVEAFLPGKTNEEILITAHLCHPRSSANDNASGVAAGMEAFHALQELIQKGELEPLERGIRMIFMPEFTGTFPWVHELGEEGRKKIKAGLNLDMVGARRGQYYGPLTLSAIPDSTPNLVWDAALFVMDEIMKSAPSLSNEMAVPMFNFALGNFEAGSDNYILSDPTIGIPTPMFGQWPDRTYHTSADTLEVIDPFILAQSAAFAASFAYTLANLKPEHLAYLMKRGRHDFFQQGYKKRLALQEKNALPEKFELQAKMRLTARLACNQTYLRYFKTNPPEIIEMVEDENEWIAQVCSGEIERFLDDFFPDYIPQPSTVPQEYNYVPKRKYIAPINKLEDVIAGDMEKTKAYKAFVKDFRNQINSPLSLDSLIQYHIDGKKTLWQIAQSAIYEANEGTVEYVHTYVQLLAQLGLVSFDTARRK